MSIAEALRGLLEAIERNYGACINDCDPDDCEPGCPHKAAEDALAAWDAGVARVRKGFEGDDE